MTLGLRVDSETQAGILWRGFKSLRRSVAFETLGLAATSRERSICRASLTDQRHLERRIFSPVSVLSDCAYEKLDDHV